MINTAIENYWQKFQESLPKNSPYRSRPFIAEGWGDGPQMADELGLLIATGKKTATCSSVWEWQSEGVAWPSPGTLTIVLSGTNQPLCIIETVEVVIVTYQDVDPDFASAEGEGDRSLAYWRDAHRTFFSRSLQKFARQFSEDMPLVCERFKLIFV